MKTLAPHLKISHRKVFSLFVHTESFTTGTNWGQAHIKAAEIGGSPHKFGLAKRRKKKWKFWDMLVTVF